MYNLSEGVNKTVYSLTYGDIDPFDVCKIIDTGDISTITNYDISLVKYICLSILLNDISLNCKYDLVSKILSICPIYITNNTPDNLIAVKNYIKLYLSNPDEVLKY